MKDLSLLVRAFPRTPLAVVGDLVADEYIHGTTSRISREAPVLVVEEERRELRPGGAANVIANLLALGGSPRPVGLVGDDPVGQALLGALAERGAALNGVQVAPERATTTKTRVLAGGRNTVRQQMLRIDRLSHAPISARLAGALVAGLREALEGASGLVVSDYGEGVVEGALLEEIFRIAAAGRLPVFVDSRARSALFQSADTLTPNEPELAQAVGFDLERPLELEAAGRALLERAGAKHVLVKRGRNGMALFSKGAPTERIGAFGPGEVADVTGAGDTVLAAYSLARLAGAAPAAAMRIANAAGGLKVQKSGTAVVGADELAAALEAAP